MFKNLKIITFFTPDSVDIKEFRKDIQEKGGDFIGAVKPKEDKTNTIVGLVCYFMSK